MDSPTFYITTLGCPKNEADSRAMYQSLRQSGLSPAADAREADYHVINSCSFIESARVETIETVLDAARVKKSRGEQKLVLAGCFAERYATAVSEDLPEVDLSFGTGLYHRAGRIVTEKFNLPDAGGLSVADALEYSFERKFERPYAPVKISDGCNRACAFCAIPSFRGSFRDRAAEDILAEVRELTRAGIREVNLVSQDTNSYGGSPGALVDLLEELESIEELAWIRPLYLYPDKKTEAVIQEIARRGLKKFTPYLESPVQHVSPTVLKAMRRAGNYEYFKDLFTMARGLFSDLEIRTTFLVGFPGETEKDLELLLRFIQEVRPEKIAFFAYSQEEDTPAHDKASDLTEEQMSERINRLREEYLGMFKEIQRSRVGRTYQCLIDEVKPDGILGHRAQDAPEVDEAVFLEHSPLTQGIKPGDIIAVEISGFYEYDMAAVPAARHHS